MQHEVLRSILLNGGIDQGSPYLVWNRENEALQKIGKGPKWPAPSSEAREENWRDSAPDGRIIGNSI